MNLTLDEWKERASGDHWTRIHVMKILEGWEETNKLAEDRLKLAKSATEDADHLVSMLNDLMDILTGYMDCGAIKLNDKDLKTYKKVDDELSYYG